MKLKPATAMLCAAVFTACADSKTDTEPVRAGEVRADSAQTRPLAPPPDSTAPIATRTVIYIEASNAELDSLAARYSGEELNTVGDDFMWYRSQAFDHIEQQGWPLRTLVGKRPLTFLVNDKPRRYDVEDMTTLDVIILYDANREPLIIAPIDIEQANEYFR